MDNASLPSVEVYYAALLRPEAAPWTCATATLGALCLVTTLVTAGDALRRTPRRLRPPTAGVLAVYPLVAAASLGAAAFPRGQLAAEAAVQVTFACCFYQLFRLLLAYCGGGAALTTRGGGEETLDLAVGPCCCWPCCALLLPRLALTTTSLRRLRLLVLQLPAVQTLVYATLLLHDHERLQPYLQPLALLSILGAVWGVGVTLRLVGGGHRAHAKFAALQAVLVLSKLQALVARGVVALQLLPSATPPFTPALRANLVYDGAMLLEVAALSVWAGKLYRRHLTSGEGGGGVSVCVVDSLYSSKTVLTQSPTYDTPCTSYGNLTLQFRPA